MEVEAADSGARESFFKLKKKCSFADNCLEQQNGSASHSLDSTPDNPNQVTVVICSLAKELAMSDTS